MTDLRECVGNVIILWRQSFQDPRFCTESVTQQDFYEEVQRLCLSPEELRKRFNGYRRSAPPRPSLADFLSRLAEWSRLRARTAESQQITDARGDTRTQRDKLLRKDHEARLRYARRHARFRAIIRAGKMDASPTDGEVAEILQALEDRLGVEPGLWAAEDPEPEIATPRATDDTDVACEGRDVPSDEIPF